MQGVTVPKEIKWTSKRLLISYNDNKTGQSHRGAASFILLILARCK